MAAIIEWFTTTFIGKILVTLGVSMVPVIELRGAIPIGMGLGLDYFTSFVASVIGNMIPIPFILIFLMKIFDWMKRRDNWMGKVVDKMLSIADKKRETVDKYGWIGLFILVAIPLPGTGAWTGALVASLFNFPKLRSFFAIFLGVLICGVIMCLASYGVFGFLSFLA